MTGSVAQIIALISHGNHFLASGEIDAFYPANSTFQYCDAVDFRLRTKARLFSGGSTSVIAEDPLKWFEYLASTGCERLRFHYQHSNTDSDIKDFNLAGMVGGGGEWSIESMYGPAHSKWTSYWEVYDADRPVRRIWRVSYGTDGARHLEPTPSRSRADSAESVRHSLLNCTEFASRHGLEGWIPTFEKAANCLESETPEEGFYHQDLLAGDISSGRRQLFYAAANAWVFGGMGSWNDNGFASDDVQRRFQSVSAELFDAINDAFTTVLN